MQKILAKFYFLVISVRDFEFVLFNRSFLSEKSDQFSDNMENSCSKKAKSSLKLCAIEIVLLCWFVPTSLLSISQRDISQDLVIRLNIRIF
jgi:hypothetical protein